MRAILLSLVAVSVSACSLPQRVTLQSPGADAPPEKRFVAFAKLRPVGVLSYRNPQQGVWWKQLQLGDDTLVTDPRDLLLVVPPDSATAQAVGRVEKHRKRKLMWTWIGRGLALGTLALLIGGIRKENGRVLIWGSGATLLGALTAGGLRVREGSQQVRETEVAYYLYENDLMRHLGLRWHYEGPRVRQRRRDPEDSIAANPLRRPDRWIENCAQRVPKLQARLGWVR